MMGCVHEALCYIVVFSQAAHRVAKLSLCHAAFRGLGRKCVCLAPFRWEMKRMRVLTWRVA